MSGARLDCCSCVQGLARSRRQQTFYSKEYALNFPVTSKQPVSEGMKDVTMGVLCSQGSHALVYRGRWRKKAVSVKVLARHQDGPLHEALPLLGNHTQAETVKVQQMTGRKVWASDQQDRVTLSSAGGLSNWPLQRLSVPQVIEARQADCIRAPAFGAAYVPKEGALCMDLEHNNVMQTFKMVTENKPGADLACPLPLDCCLPKLSLRV